MKPDITGKADIEELVNLFYQKVRADKTIGFFFSDVIPVIWEKHIPMMCRFWENVLFYTGEYEGNPMDAHLKIHFRHPTRPEHFNRWLQLFDEATDELFAGTRADIIKQHSRAIAAVMMENIRKSSGKSSL